MKRALLFLGVLALIAVFGALVVLNPGEVEFRPTHVHHLRPMLGVLLFFTFIAGIVAAVAAGALQQAGDRLAHWRERRQARRAAQAGTWHQTGEHLAWEGDLDRSRALLKKAWRRHPARPAAALALASSYMDTGEYGAARGVLETALADHADDPDLRYALGEALRRQGDHADAIRMLEAVRVRHPRAPRVLVSLRELYTEAQRWADAAAVQEMYVQTLPAHERDGERQRLLHYRYQAALGVSDPTARLEGLDAAVRDDRGFVPALVSLGDALVACGRSDEAKKVWERAFRQQPRLVFVERLLAHQQSERDVQRAIGLLTKYRDQLDADSVHLLLARAALAANQVDQAARELEAVQQPDTATAQRYWAEIHHRRGQHEEAWNALRRAADRLGTLASDHRCTACGRFSEEWTGWCPGCGGWDTYRTC